MKDTTKEWLRRVILTTGVSFFLITFLFVGIFALIGDDAEGGKQTFFQFFSYLFIKLFLCVFPFSLSLGFANRIMEQKKKNRAVLRMIHFFVTFAAYFIFMDLLFNIFNFAFGFQEGQTQTGTLIRQTLPFFLFYPLTVWVNRLGRWIITPKEKREYKSILD